MNPIAEKQDEEFWGKLLNHIVEEGRRTPKVQVERSIGPILGFFLEKAISDLLGSDVITLAHEFPLKKAGDNQSTNIDWLMYDKTENELLLIELKTEMSSFSSKQLESYLSLVDVEAPWKYLWDGFGEICDASSNWKYQYARTELNRKIKKHCQNIEEASARLLYIAPMSGIKECAGESAYSNHRSKDSGSKIADFMISDSKGSGSKVSFYPFGALRMRDDDKMEGNFGHYRRKLYEALQKLDDECNESNKDLRKTRDKYCEGALSLKDMLAKCEERNPEKSIVVGFTGGKKKLRQQNSSYLEQRLYKWDWESNRDSGVKNENNWIKASEFVSIVKTLLSPASRREDEIQRLAEQISRGLRNNPELTLGQLIDEVSRSEGIPLNQLSDDALVKALAEEPSSLGE